MIQLEVGLKKAIELRRHAGSSIYPPSRLTFCPVTSRNERRMAIILPRDCFEWFIRIS